MARVTRPPRGSPYRIKADGYVVGVYYVDGRRIFRDLGKLSEFERTERGRRRTTHQLNLAIQRRWEERLAELQEEAEQGRGSREPISAVLQKWVEWAEGARMAGNTINNHYRLLQRQYVEAAGDHPVGRIGVEDVDRYRAYLLNAGNNPVTVNLKLAKLRTFLGWAKERGYLHELPPIRRVRENKRVPRIPSQADIRALLERVHRLATTEPNLRHRYHYELHELMYVLVLGSAMRRSEMFYRPWSEVYLDSGLALVTDSKEGEDKLVVLAGFTVDYLRRWREKYPHHKWLFDNGQQQLAYSNPMALTRAARRHMDAVGLRDSQIKPLHGFRSNLATVGLNELGLPSTAVQQILNHASFTTTEAAYLASRTAEKQRAMQELEQRYFPGLQIEAILSEAPMEEHSTS